MAVDWISNFFQLGALPPNIMEGSYNPYLVLLSYVIASFASFVALDMSAHLRKPTTSLFRITWLIGGAIIMGAGIWSMHFVGMLAFDMAMPMTYNFLWTGTSMVVAIITAAFAFLFFTIKKPQFKHYVMCGIILGAAIPTMHYTGMAGMEGVKIHYLPFPFALSILIAIIAAIAAVWLAVQSDRGTFIVRLRLKFFSALIMGFAIVGMHYMGMYAAVFTMIPAEHKLTLDPTLLSIFIATVVICITLLGLVISTSKYILTTAVQKEKDFLETILNQMRGGVIACDLTGKITLVNNAILDLMGLSIRSNENVWTKESSFYKPANITSLKRTEYPLERALKGETVKDDEMISIDKAGNKHYLMVNAQPLTDNERQRLGAVAIYHDVSMLKKSEEEQRYSATHDVLTALPNRALLLDRLKQSIALANRNDLKTTVIFIDIDNFKYINDALGHSIGDSLLQKVSSRFLTTLRASDTLSRLGGDEFVIVLPDQKGIASVPSFLQRVLDIVVEPYNIQGHELRVTCSAGVSVYPENGTDAETLLKNADAAMYQAKEAGRNTFRFYTGEMHTQIRKRLDIENGLRKALINNEFFLEYQPKMEIKTNKLIGYEALIRWNHPKFGVIPPDEFISIAEDTRLILPIGKWVLRTACAQNKAWQNAGLPPLCVSVNISSKQCKEKTLIPTIKEVLQETQLDPQYLELELTESAAMLNPDEFMKVISACKALGVKTSIDDFGTGYSSLDYLRKFPVNTLKIDRAFISELEKKADLSIVKAIISLGHSLNLKVIAEGVETEKQLRQLKDNNCDEIQGYFFSRPISSNDMVEFIKTYFKEKE